MKPFKITDLWAYIGCHADGEEGVMAFQHDGVWTPMIGADKTRIDSLRPVAEQVSKEANIPYKLKHFKLVED